MIYQYMFWTTEIIAGLSTAAIIYAEWKPHEKVQSSQTKEEAMDALCTMTRWISAGCIGYGVTIALLIVAAYGMAGKK